MISIWPFKIRGIGEGEGGGSVGGSAGMVGTVTVPEVLFMKCLKFKITGAWGRGMSALTVY